MTNSSERETLEPAKESLPRRLGRFFFGYDVFITYARHDAREYSVALARALAEQDVVCFLDQWGTVPGKELPPGLILRLKRSSMLVVIGSPSAATSRPLQQEVEIFRRTGRTIVPVSVANTIERSELYQLLEGLPFASESDVALRTAAPAPSVIAAITGAAGFIRRTTQLRRTFWRTVAGVIAVSVAGVVFVVGARQQAQLAERKADSLTAQNLRAQRELEIQQGRIRAVSAVADAAQLASEAMRLRDAEVREAGSYAPEQAPLSVLLALESVGRTPGRLLPAAQAVLRWAVTVLAVPEIEINAGNPHALNVDSYGERVAASYDDGRIVVWNGRGVRVAQFRTTTAATALAFPSDSTRIAVGVGPDLLYVDYTKPRIVPDTLMRGWRVRAMVFTPLDYNIHGVASLDFQPHALRSFEARQREVHVAFSAATRRVPGFLPDVRTFPIRQEPWGIAPTDSGIGIASVDSLVVVTITSRDPSKPAALPLKFSPWNTFDIRANLVASVNDGTQVVFSRLDKLPAPPSIVPIPGQQIGQVAFGRDIAMLAVSSASKKPMNTVHVVGVHNNLEYARMLQPSVARALYFSRQRARIVTLGRDGVVRRWSLPRLDATSIAAFDSEVTRFSPERLVAEARKRVQRQLTPAELKQFLPGSAQP